MAAGGIFLHPGNPNHEEEGGCVHVCVCACLGKESGCGAHTASNPCLQLFKVGFEICQYNPVSRLQTSGPGHRREEPAWKSVNSPPTFSRSLVSKLWLEAGEKTGWGVSRSQHRSRHGALQKRGRAWAPRDPLLPLRSSVTTSPWGRLPFCEMMGLNNRTFLTP